MPRSPDITPPPGHYRAVHWAAVVSLVLGVLSATAALSLLFLFLPLSAILLGWLARRRIARMPEEFTGDGLAWAGIALAVVLGLAGGGFRLWASGREIPPGYQPIDYVDLQDPKDPQKTPENIMKLDFETSGTKVFIKGFMIPGGQQIRLKKFTVCPTNGECTFHPPNPRKTEIIKVQLMGDLMANYTQKPLALGGRLHVDPLDPRGLPYTMDVDYLR
jgi:hypothetical protein